MQEPMVEVAPDSEEAAFPTEITFELGTDETKTSHVYESGIMKETWQDGDAVFVAPSGKAGKGACYRIKSGGASTGTFTADKSITTTSSSFNSYYPGDYIQNDVQFNNFTYGGQVQKKSDPTAHLSEYMTMRKTTSHSKYSTVYDVSSVSFQGGDHSGCMRFVLSGMTFKNPYKITLSVIQNGKVASSVLNLSNYLSSYTEDSTSSDYYEGLQTTSSLSLELEGYGEETSLEAFMALSNYDMTLSSGSTLRVTVYAGSEAYYSDTRLSKKITIKGGYCSTLTVDGGWTKKAGDYTQYSWDGDVVTLQESGTGPDLIFMGDGFIKEDFDNGTYDRLMRAVCSEFFGIEPFTTLKSGFNAYYVKVVSPQRIEATNCEYDGAINSGNETKLSVAFEANSTGIEGDDELALAYAFEAVGEDINRLYDATIIILANQDCHAGTCYNWFVDSGTDYGAGPAVSYFALGSEEGERADLVQHEAGGHGFGKLDDEYFYDDITESDLTSSDLSNLADYWEEYDAEREYGFWRNTDKYLDQSFLNKMKSYGSYSLTTAENVYWHDMIGTSNNYESEDVESLGVYKGGATYCFGFCRPTYDEDASIMNYSGQFNAVCRRQIYYRYRRLTGQLTTNCWGKSSELSSFLEWDATILPKILPATKASTATRSSMLERRSRLPRPVMVHARWENGKLVPTEKQVSVFKD